MSDDNDGYDDKTQPDLSFYDWSDEDEARYEEEVAIVEGRVDPMRGLLEPVLPPELLEDLLDELQAFCGSHPAMFPQLAEVVDGDPDQERGARVFH